jgi:hypothetical protein
MAVIFHGLLIQRKTQAMKKQILLLIAAVLTTAVSAQEVVSSGGDSLEGSGVILDFTVGQLAIETLNGSAQLTQGFHQTELEIVAVREMDSASFSVYPNPTSDKLTFDLSSFNEVQSIDILDLSGRVVLHAEGSLSASLELDLSHLSRGSYVARIIYNQSSDSSSTLIQKL